MKQSPLHEVARTVAKFYGIHPDCLSNLDNSQTQIKARQTYVLLALKLGYTVGDTAKTICRSVKQVYNVASAARKNRLENEDMQLAYSVCMNVLLQKGEKIRNTTDKINYKKYDPFVVFTKKERADMLQAQLDAEKFMQTYGQGQAAFA